MPPKKASNEKPEELPILINGLTKDEISQEQLEDQIMRLREEMDREKEERDYFQLERDKLRSFRDTTERELTVVQAERNNLDTELEEAKIHPQIELKVYRQKMRYLLSEHQHTICELKADWLVSKEAMQTEQTTTENELKNQIAALRVEVEEVDIQTPIMELIKKHKEEKVHLTDILDKTIKDADARLEPMLHLLEQDLEQKLNTEISQVTESWNNYISTLVQQNQEAYIQAWDFDKNIEQMYNETSIRQKDIASKATEIIKVEKELAQLLQDKQQLNVQLSFVQNDIDIFKKKMTFTTDIIPKKSLSQKETKAQERKYDIELMQKKFKEMQQRIEEIHRTHTERTENIQKKREEDHLKMQTKIQELTDKIQRDFLLMQQ